MIISWSCWIQYLFAPSGSLLKSSRFWEPKEQTLWRSSKCSDPIHLCMSTHFFKYVLPPENGSSGCFAGCPSVALPSFILFIIGSQTSSVNVQHGSFNTHITLIAFLLWMNECGPKKCLLLVFTPHVIEDPALCVCCVSRAKQKGKGKERKWGRFCLTFHAHVSFV